MRSPTSIRRSSRRCGTRSERSSSRTRCWRGRWRSPGPRSARPRGCYPPDALVHEAKRRGIEILPPDVNVSELDCRVETVGAEAGSAGNPPVRIGLGYVAEVAEIDAKVVIEERRRGGSYRSIS